jgi:hypothetical protein
MKSSTLERNSTAVHEAVKVLSDLRVLAHRGASHHIPLHQTPPGAHRRDRADTQGGSGPKFQWHLHQGHPHITAAALHIHLPGGNVTKAAIAIDAPLLAASTAECIEALHNLHPIVDTRHAPPILTSSPQKWKHITCVRCSRDKPKASWVAPSIGLMST